MTSLMNNNSDDSFEPENQSFALTAKADYHYHRAEQYVKIGKPDKAIEELNLAINITQDPHYYCDRGKIFSDLCDFENALSDFSMAIALNRNLAEAYNLRAFQYFIRERLEEAANDLSMAIALQPDQSCFFINRGRVYRENEHFLEALADFSSAIRLDPREPLLYRERGELYYECGHYEDAMADFENAVSLNPSDVLSHSYRAVICKTN